MGSTRLARHIWGCLAGAALVVGAMGSAQADELRIATLAPDGSAWMKILSRGAQEAEKRTSGRVVLKYYANGVQGDEKDVVSKMKLGQLDGAALTSVGLSLIDESIRVLELPMLFEDVKELDYVRAKMWPTFRKRFAKKGFHLGDPGDVGFIYFYSNTPVKSLKSLQSAKVWMWGDDQIVRSMYKKLGINGVPLGVPEVLPALNTGRINACYGSPLAAVALQWYTKVKYSTSMPMSYGIGASVIKTDAWKKISADDQKVMKKVIAIQGKKLRKAVRKDNKRAFKAMGRSGVKVIETPAAVIAQFDQAAKATWKALEGRMYSKDDLAMVLKYRDEYRAKHRK